MGTLMRPASLDDASVSNPIRERLGKRVRRLRERHGWTQAVCAEKFGLNVTYLGLLERGQKNICLDTLHIIAVGFGVSLSRLLSGV
ncbi:MAG: XRE family transcriptional regulator [Candidatus Angelobacter sp. Gp1-AA117]|nr:MAG: XRE family transcriptional regulator [Candidatus Angelobacter sp. Gp1-AA117]